MRTLVLGAIKSGKSRHAETLAAATGDEVVYLATADPGDAGMRERIARHRARRPAHWYTRETGESLAAAIDAEAAVGRCLIVDCLTLWLVRFLERPDAWAAERSALLELLPALPGSVVMVSNEVGGGVIPADPVSRWFVDEAGRLHQALAGCCQRVVWVTAGLPLTLKDDL
ncbi:MAG: bifunctional adenosylcobinamide kinase/adenosylcobinamide-phosphate guanylyltransferase [Arhodomonas sp.]|nr:bifunctional adenosylcobinamide kinase/adenosylcobinamide-phosphate guanylyltransferase [Arhodomonas sp.]